MADKTTTLEAAVAEIESGMTIGIGGWGSRRKPMAFIRALLRTDVTDLTVVTYGGPDLGLLCAAGKVKRVYYGFVSLDSPPFYDPWFAKARTSGAIEAREMDEGMLRCGLQAAAQRLPFLPIRAGLGSGVGKALDRLAQYYIKLAEQTFPVIEVDAGREIDVVITKGVRIEGVDTAKASPTSYPRRADPAERYMKVNDDED